MARIPEEQAKWNHRGSSTGPLVDARDVAVSAPDSPTNATTSAISTATVLQSAAAHYHTSLKTSPIALQHVKWRGTIARDLVEHFQLGLSDNTLGARSTSQPLRAELVRLGVIRTNGDERFAGSLVVPVFDAAGQVVQLRGGEYHVVTGRNTNERFCPRGLDAVFHLAGFAISEEVIVAPTAMDALRFWYAGHVNVTALGEDLALTDGHLAEMMRAGTKRVVLALNAGDKADAIAIAVAGRLADAGIHAYRATIGRRFMPTSRQWGELIRDAHALIGAPPRPAPPPIDLDWTRLPKKETAR